MGKILVDKNFWVNKTIFLTGHTGFKGSWLALWLWHMGAKVIGYSMPAKTDNDLFNLAKVSSIVHRNTIADIRDLPMLKKSLVEAKPDIVIHMAAQALVKDSYDDPVGTYATNVMGTVNVLESARSVPSIKAILAVTSDKCYENNEWIWGYRENEPMGGRDPYSNSKGCAELICAAYRASFFNKEKIALATVRAGNVVGGGDWAKDRIVPDAVRSFLKKEALIVRNPLSIRPWQHVLDPLSAYLLLCQKLFDEPGAYSEGWNIGPSSASACDVSTLANFMVSCWGGSSSWAPCEGIQPVHEAKYLKLDCSKAKERLNWQASWDIETTISETIRWYRAYELNKDMQNFTIKQITEFYENDDH